MFNAPCYIGHNITAEIAQDVLTSINGKNRTNKSAAFIHVAPLNDIIKNHEHEYPKDSERVAVYLTGSSRKNPKDTVKFLRDRCNMDKREAKEAAENTSSSFENKNIPVCLATGLPLSEARTLLLDVYDQLEDGKAEYRWQ